MRACWCGNTDFRPFGPEYGECTVCGTLAYLKEMPSNKLLVQNDELDFYGKSYWLERQQDAFGTGDIFTRARTDLTERNLHWLKALLKYSLPGAKALELGCSHGSFVALLRLAGYDASGVEMSPWVVEFGKQTFGVPISVGPLENLDAPPGSLDIIVSMDVLEHLPDPVTTMARCLELLKPDGLLLLQTPQFRNGVSYEELRESKGRFLEMLIPEEHIYLFSEDSAARLFRQLGAEYIQFEPAIFGHYDMFFAVSRAPFRTQTQEQIRTALESFPNGRLTLALLDLRERELASESDRIARGEQIETLTQMVKVSEVDRAARGEQVEALTQMVRVSEADRAARAEQARQLTAWLNGSEANLLKKDEQVAELTNTVHAKDEQVAELTNTVHAKDEQVAELTNTVHAKDEQVAELTNTVEQSKAETIALNEEIYTLLADLRSLFGHRAFRLLAKIARWREAKKLENRIKQP
jgi:2-polyprenyl-3-methyl-5-hydroxy-6-metoxy-1,4-benzoquinol methylase